MPFKTLFFYSIGNQGFSETWYINTGPVDTAHFNARTTLYTARQAMLGEGCYIQGVRTTDLSTKGSTLFTAYPAPVVVSGGNPVRDNATNALQVRLTAAGAYKRTMWLRGGPDDWQYYDINAAEFVNQNIPNLLSSFIAACNQVGVGLRAIGNTLAINPQITIIGLGTEAGTGRVTISINENPPYAVGQYVSIVGVQGANLRSAPPWNQNINGTWQVMSTGIGVFSINALTADFSSQPIFYGGGTVRSKYRVDNYPGSPGTFPAIISSVVLRFARRKTGRALFTPAGRSRAVRRM